MTEFQVQTRPDGDSHSRSTKSRHRAEPATQASALSRLATGLGITGRRAAVITAACAMLVGGGAASQAAEPGSHGHERWKQPNSHHRRPAGQAQLRAGPGGWADRSSGKKRGTPDLAG